jgi:hypothetical protein
MLGKGYAPAAGLEANFEEGLSLAGRLCACVLARARDPREAAGTIVYIVVQSLTHTTDKHPIENVEELNSQLASHTLAKKEALGQRKIFVCVERLAKNANDARLVALFESRIGKGRLAKDGKPFVIIVVIEIKWNLSIEVSTVEAVQERIVVIRVDGVRSPRSVLKDAADLPASQDILRQNPAFV